MRIGIRFCWMCGDKLRGNHFDIVIIDGLDRICHKYCAKRIRKDPEYVNRIDNKNKD